MYDLSGAQWRKSSYSANVGCVEVASLGSRVAVRDSKDKHGPVLVFTRTEWSVFLNSARDGKFDLPRRVAA
jgi:Domain of unknown function (DUF397)